MRRSESPEIMDGDDISNEELTKCYRQLEKLHRWLGNTGAIIRLLKHSQAETRRVLDIGCGLGGLLVEIREKLGVEVIGFDLRPPTAQVDVPIVTGNAVTDPLPKADVAISMMTAHHLSEDELTCLIQNVARSCQRLILLDPVRHPLPLALFRIFVAPWLGWMNAIDGQTSIKRAFTVAELQEIASRASAAANRPVKEVRHRVAPLWTRQIVDIVWEKTT